MENILFTEAQISTLIGAAIGVVGIILNNVIIAAKEYIKDSNKDKRDSAYLAILVISHLERFTNNCLDVARDDGFWEGQPAGGNNEFRQATIQAPKFTPLEIKVEWKVLPKKLLHEIFQIPERRENIENYLRHLSEFEDPYDRREIFWNRQHDYAELGLHVSAITKKLRKHAGISSVNVSLNEEFSREDLFQKVINEVNADRAEYEKQNELQ
jgi:hypothetical protein